MNRRPVRASILGALVTLGALCGCSVATGAPSTPAQMSAEIGVGRVPHLGRVLVDSQDRTLYLYVPDERGTSRCTGFCAKQWPPLLASDDPGGVRFGPGVDPARVGSIPRSGGGRQLTYDGWPLYTWRLDSRPGEASGEGDDMGLWFAISPSGHAVTKP